MSIFGYARVSTDHQTLEAQREALLAAGAEKVFQETASGAKSDRKELARALKALNAGDVLLVTRLGAAIHRAKAGCVYRVGKYAAGCDWLRYRITRQRINRMRAAINVEFVGGRRCAIDKNMAARDCDIAI